MAADEANVSTSDTNSQININSLSHKQKKALWKKQKRKLLRQAAAKERDAQKAEEEEARKQSPSYAAKLEQEELEEKAEILRIAEESKRQHELWLWHEDLFAEKLKRQKEQEENERLQRLEIERKIKEEWEERQKKEREEEEEKRQKKEKQEELLQQAREAENKDGDWHNPLAPVQYGQERQIETCPFFAKVGACRFGDRCSRGHPLPDSGRTLLFSSMFRHFQLDQGLCEEYDTDIVLEYEDSEVYQKFREFYEDTLPEFKADGQVLQFKVCCNYQPHLRGNVYVSYSREDEAYQAYTKFNARWYGGKQLSAQFVNIPSWRRAICGLFGRGRCPKGKECNFLHVFKNPNNEFNQADRDMESFTPQHRNNGLRKSSRRSRSRSTDRRRRHSRSPSRKQRYSRSRSRERHRSYRSSSRRSRSRDRHLKSRSRDNHNSYRSDSVKRHSRSKSREKSQSSYYRAKDKNKYRTSYSRSRSRSKEKSSKNKRREKKDSKKNIVVEDNECFEKLVEKTKSDRDNGIFEKSKSSSIERSRSRSRSSSRDSEVKKKHKKKKKKHKH